MVRPELCGYKKIESEHDVASVLTTSLENQSMNAVLLANACSLRPAGSARPYAQRASGAGLTNGVRPPCAAPKSAKNGSATSAVWSSVMRSAYVVDRSVCRVGADTFAGLLVFHAAARLNSVRETLRKPSSLVMNALNVASVVPAAGGFVVKLEEK